MFPKAYLMTPVNEQDVKNNFAIRQMLEYENEFN